MRGVTEQLAAALSQNHGLRQVLHDMQATEAELRAHAERLERANQALTESNEALAASGRELAERNAALAKSLDEVRSSHHRELPARRTHASPPAQTTARADALEQEHADAQRELAALRRELGEVRVRGGRGLSRACADCTSHTHTHACFPQVRQVESGKVRAQLEEAQRALADAEAEIAKLRAASQMERKIELRRLLDEKMHELRRQVSEVSKQSAEYSDVLQRLVANMGDYETRVATASRQSTADSAQVAEIRTTLLAQVDSLGERARDLDRQLRETTSQLEREREAASRQQQLAVGAQEELHKVEAELRMAKAANPHEDSRRVRKRVAILVARSRARESRADTRHTGDGARPPVAEQDTVPAHPGSLGGQRHVVRVNARARYARHRSALGGSSGTASKSPFAYCARASASVNAYAPSPPATPACGDTAVPAAAGAPSGPALSCATAGSAAGWGCAPGSATPTWRTGCDIKGALYCCTGGAIGAGYVLSAIGAGTLDIPLCC